MLGHESDVRRVIEPSGPPFLKFREVAAANSAPQELGRCCLKPRLGRNLAVFQFLQPLAPPGELDRGELRLGRAHDNVGHGIVDIEQGVESGPQLDRPVEPDQVAVAQFSDR